VQPIAFSFSAAVFPISRAVSKLPSHAQRGQGKQKSFLPKYTPCPQKGAARLLNRICRVSG